MPGSPRITLYTAPGPAVGVPTAVEGSWQGLQDSCPLHPAMDFVNHCWQWLCCALQQSSMPIQMQSPRHLEQIPEKSLHPTSQGVASELSIQVTGYRWPCLTSSILCGAGSRQGMTDRLCFYSVFCILFNIQLSGRGICLPQQCCI